MFFFKTFEYAQKKGYFSIIKKHVKDVFSDVDEPKKDLEEESKIVEEEAI